jgi:hypothetical protein
MYFAGGSTATHSIEEGVRPVGPITLRADHESKLIWITLPLEKSETTTGPVIDCTSKFRDKDFAGKLGGRAEDLARKFQPPSISDVLIIEVHEMILRNWSHGNVRCTNWIHTARKGCGRELRFLETCSIRIIDSSNNQNS